MIRALIFDFDGLILDTETPRFRSWQEICREHGCDLSVEDWAALIDRSLDPVDPVACLEQCLGYPVDRRAIHARRIQVAIPNLVTRSLSMSQADLTLVSLTDAPLQKLLTWASGDPA